MCLAAPVFLRRIGELTPTTLVISLVSAVALLAAIVAFAVVDLAGGSPAMWVVAGIAALCAVAIAWRLRRPLGQLGSYDVPVADAVLGGVAPGDAGA